MAHSKVSEQIDGKSNNAKKACESKGDLLLSAYFQFRVNFFVLYLHPIVCHLSFLP